MSDFFENLNIEFLQLFRPKKDFLGLSIKIPEIEENDSLINSAELIT